MGNRGSSNYDERDKLFQKSFQESLQDRTLVKKNLEKLFTPKIEDPCLKGHAWVRDWDRINKCARCKTIKPEGLKK